MVRWWVWQVVNVALGTEIGMRCHVQYRQGLVREAGWS
jgi:hypothetical protein